MSVSTVNVFGKGREVLCVVTVHGAKDLSEVMEIAVAKLIEEKFDPVEIITMETGDVVYSKFLYSIQVHSSKLESEYLIDGYVMADNPLRARNYGTIIANAVVDLPDNAKWGLKLIGVSVQPFMELVN